jgi:hypothetical protein
MKVPLDGGTPGTLASGQYVIVAMVVDATNVYWTAESNVMKVPLGGGIATTLATGQDLPAGIAVDATSVYWATQGTFNKGYRDGTLMRVLLMGGSAATLVSGNGSPSAVAVDPTSVYWTNHTPTLLTTLLLGGNIADDALMKMTHALQRDKESADLGGNGPTSSH